MTSALRLAAALLTLALAPLVESQSEPVEPTTAAVTVAVRQALELDGLASGQTTMILHTVELFDIAGLELPPLVVTAGEEGVDCDGHHGLHQPRDGWSEIELCATAQTAAVMHTVLHEMAHAWASHGLSAEVRQSFMTLRGVDVWRDYDVADWEDNGTEQAAEIIAWGVNDVAASTVRINQVSSAELAAGYVALTGSEPSYGLTDVCGNAAAITRS